MLKILSFGDSITQGKVVGDSIKELSYRYWLWEKLDSPAIKSIWLEVLPSGLQKIDQNGKKHLFPLIPATLSILTVTAWDYANNSQISAPFTFKN
jgi:hypothetical protein